MAWRKQKQTLSWARADFSPAPATNTPAPAPKAYSPVTVGVTIPALWSLIPALFVSLISFITGAYFLPFAVQDSAAFALIVFLVVSYLVWCQSQNDALQLVKRLIGVDTVTVPAEDVTIEQPTSTTLNITLYDKSGNVKRQLRPEFPLSPDKLLTLAEGLTAKPPKPFTVSAWTGRGNPLSRAEFERVRAEFEQMGMIEWVNSEAREKGVRLTSFGTEALEGLLAELSPTLLTA